VQRNSVHATLLSRLTVEKDLGKTSWRAASLLETGPRPLEQAHKRGRHELVDVPHYCRGFVWSNSLPDIISPAAKSSETAAPLPSPPRHLWMTLIFLPRWDHSQAL
jgi:hypothetical protein